MLEQQELIADLARPALLDQLLLKLEPVGVGHTPEPPNFYLPSASAGYGEIADAPRVAHPAPAFRIPH